jgi:hypothetical protein
MNAADPDARPLRETYEWHDALFDHPLSLVRV